MSEIIEIVQGLINDLDGDNFSTIDVQRTLDRNREEHRYLTLDRLPTYASGGGVTYLIYCAPAGLDHFESDSALVDYNYDSASPASSDWINGRWTFSSEPSYPIRLTGFSYDIYGAAADLLEERASQVSEDLRSVNVYNGSFAFGSNKRAGPLQLAQKYRAMSRKSIMTTDIVRTDLNGWGMT